MFAPLKSEIREEEEVEKVKLKICLEEFCMAKWDEKHAHGKMAF